MSQLRGVSYALAGGQCVTEERIRVSSNVYVADGDAGCEQDEQQTYTANPDEIRKNHRAFSVSLRSAALITGALLMMMCIVILFNAANKAELTKKIDAMTVSISQTVKENYDLNIQVVSARESTRISYKAVQDLGMISEEGAETYYITAPNTRTSVASDSSLPGDRKASSGSR